VWDTSSSRLLKRIDGPLIPHYQATYSSFEGVAFSDDGERLLSLQFGLKSVDYYVWDASSYVLLQTLKGERQTRPDSIDWIGWTPRAEQPAYVMRSELHAWNPEKRTSETTRLGWSAPHCNVRIDEKQRLLAIGGSMHVVLCPYGAPEEGKMVKDLTANWGDRSPDGEHFVSLRFDFKTRTTNLMLRSPDDLSERGPLRLKHGPPAYCGWDETNGWLVVMTFQGVVECWDLSGPEYRGRLRESVRFGSSSDPRIEYGAGGRREPMPLSMPTSLLVSPDGEQVCYVGGRQFVLFDADWQK